MDKKRNNFLILLFFFSGFLAGQKDSLDYFFEQCKKYYSENDTFKFLSVSDKYLKLDSSDWRMYLNRGVFLNKISGQKMNAIVAYRKARRLNSESYKPLLNMGSTYIDLQEYRLAHCSLDSAKRLAPENAKIHYFLGVCYTKLDNLDSALYYFDHSEKLNANDPVLYKDRGILFNLQKKYQNAISDFERAIELDPKSWQTYCAMANALMHINQHPRAKMYLDDAALLSKDASIDFFMAVYFLNVGNKSMACKSFRTAYSKGLEEAKNFIKESCK